MNKIQRVVDAMTIVMVCLLLAAVVLQFFHSAVAVVNYEFQHARYAPLDHDRLRVYLSRAADEQAAVDYAFYAERARGGK